MFENMILLIIAFVSVLLVNTDKLNDSKRYVSAVIPAFNEEKSIEHVIKTVKQVKDVHQIIVVDDGSTDKTAQIVSKFDDVLLLQHKTNKGKGSAMKTGLKRVSEDIVLFLDADLSEINKSQIEKIITPIMDDVADITKTKFKREAGRVTELTAKPLLQFFFPELSFEQPLSGQFAAIKTFLDKIDLEHDYGVDIGIVLDADALGMRILEVDIGNIVHEMSTLTELNLMANEVVRTIVDRAISYGRLTMMDDLGYAIRMEILGLSITMFGIFALFFIKFITAVMAAVILIIGVIISAYYIMKIIRMTIKINRQSKVSTSQMIKSFVHMHFPVIISIFILLVIVITLVGSVNISSNEISIEPTTKNLVISTSPTDSSRSLDVRGPYTVENAFESENQLIRVPVSALNTLQAQYGDYIYIDNERYQLEQPANEDNNVLRIPKTARNALKVESGTVIRDSDLRNLFENAFIIRNMEADEGRTNDTQYLENNLSNINYNNTSVSIAKRITTNQFSEKILSVYVNDTLVGRCGGHIRNDTYNIYVNGIMHKSLYLDDSSNGSIANFTYQTSNVTVKLEDTQSNTTNLFASSNDYVKFMNIEIY